MATQVRIGVVSCLLLIGGCFASPQQPTTPSSPARTVSTPMPAGEEVLVVGMGLGEALEMITRRGIEFQIPGLALAREEEVVAAQYFLIDRRDIDDALIIYAASEGGEKMRVRKLIWWRNYKADRELPKGVRKGKWDYVKSVSMAEVERIFSFELNPYDSSKVVARERNR